MMPEIKAVTVTRCPRPLDDTHRSERWDSNPRLPYARGSNRYLRTGHPRLCVIAEIKAVSELTAPCG